MSAVNLFEQWQDDVIARIGTDAYFSDVFTIEERLGTTETAINTAMQQTQLTSGKKPGIAAIVSAPKLTPSGGQSNLQWKLLTRICVLEQPKLNRTAAGCNKWASSVMLELVQLLHNWVVGNTTALIVEISPFNDARGLVGYVLMLEWRTGITSDAKCRAPGISGNSAAVVLANSESGAAVYFTTDGSLPTAAAGTLYTTAFASTVGTLIRAVAVLAGKKDSDVAQLTLKS